MVTIISGTNRAGSMTLVTAGIYYERLKTKGIDTKLLSLEDKEVWTRGKGMLEIEEEYLIPAEKFIFILPEYNASFPGIVKCMIDNSDIKKCWWNKSALLTGIADGRAGNIRGIDHMTNILHYIKVHVHYNKLVFSKIKEEISSEGTILKPETDQAIEQQLNEFLNIIS
jgi:chromate reductase